jgi:hypothetical protein
LGESLRSWSEICQIWTWAAPHIFLPPGMSKSISTLSLMLRNITDIISVFLVPLMKVSEVTSDGSSYAFNIYSEFHGSCKQIHLWIAVITLPEEIASSAASVRS